MPCYSPMKGYRSRERNPTGKRSIVFNIQDGYLDMPVTLPCGQCIGCRLERSRQWAIRCVHEAQLYERNCFITLTYNDENLPSDGSLKKTEFQKFMKRLRKEYGDGIRYFHCGEYGERFQRPHYHACLFNFDFDDRVLFQERDGVRLYVSASLARLWPFGFSTIGDVTFESAAYVARYITKKITGDQAADHYGSRTPEYITMSRRPGIGRPWLERFSADVYPSDHVVLRGKQLRPPKYYDNIFELEDPTTFAKVVRKRLAAVQDSEWNQTPERLAVREFIQLEKCKLLRRSYEDGH